MTADSPTIPDTSARRAPHGWRWAPAWVLTFVALWPAPGYAEAVMVLGALAAIVRLLMDRFRDGARLLSSGAWALTSALFAAYWLPQVLEGFKRRYPGVLPRVVVGNSKLTEDRVAARDLDIGLIEIATEQHTIERRSATRDELLVICSPDHPLAKFKQLTARDLVGHPFIDRDPGNGVRQIADEFFIGLRQTGERTRAFVQVQNGCDHRCTFCIIPYGRGNSRSVPMGGVVEQARKLVENGYREVVLTGVDLTSWGADLPAQPRLGDGFQLDLLGTSRPGDGQRGRRCEKIFHG